MLRWAAFISNEVFSDELLVMLGEPLPTLAAAKLLAISAATRCCCAEPITELPLEEATVSADRKRFKISVVLKRFGKVVKREL